MALVCMEYPKKKQNPTKEEAFIPKEHRQFCRNRSIEMEYCTPRMHTVNRVERSIQTLNCLIIANLEDEQNLTESVNRPLRVIRFSIHTGLKITPFELHHEENRESK